MNYAAHNKELHHSLKLSEPTIFMKSDSSLLKDGKPFITDNGNVILDISGLQIASPEELERIINNMAGVVTVGLFAQRGANVCLLGSPDGVKVLEFDK